MRFHLGAEATGCVKLDLKCLPSGRVAPEAINPLIAGFTPGILKLAPSGIGWKTSDSENIVTISAEEFKKMQWMRVARNYQLRIALKNGNAARFDGFNKDVCITIFFIIYVFVI